MAAGDLQGLAYFPGINQLVSATYTRSHGTAPGVATVEIAPQANFTASTGTLEFAYGNTRLPFRNCRLDQHSFRLNSQGEVWALAIQDRRWMWAYGEISGHYNVRNPDGSVMKRNGNVEGLKTTERSPRELATACLIAMGESAFDVSELPDDMRPEVHWERHNPAQALSMLCDQFGCRVVLKLDDSVKICKTGTGAELIKLSVMEDSLSINPRQMPSEIKVVCNRTRFQADLVLIPVGMDLDGEVVPIDDLSYAPAAGWSRVNPLFFAEVTNSLKARDLAKATVWKWYGVSTLRNMDGSNDGQLIPGYGKIRSRQQILPIESEQVETYVDSDGSKKNLPAMVYGEYAYGVANVFVNTAAGTWYRYKFNVERERAIVQFEEHVFKVDTDGTFIPAIMVLRTAVSVRDTLTGADHRFERGRKYGGEIATGPEIVKREDIILTSVPTYNANGVVTNLTTNVGEVQTECDYQLDSAELKYQATFPQERGFVGLVPIDLDGAIQQVTWNVGGGGTTTKASRNNEFSTVVPSYEERQFVNGIAKATVRDIIAADTARRLSFELTPPLIRKWGG